MHTLKKKFEKGWSSPRKDVKLQIELSHRNCLDKFQIREMKLAGNGKAKLWAGKQDEHNVLCLGLNSGVERLFCGFSREAEIGRCLVVRETQGIYNRHFTPFRDTVVNTGPQKQYVQKRVERKSAGNLQNTSIVQPKEPAPM